MDYVISVARQYDTYDDEYMQLRVNIVFEKNNDTPDILDSIWSDMIDGSIFDYIRESEVYEWAKNKKIKDVTVNLDET